MRRYFFVFMLLAMCGSAFGEHAIALAAKKNPKAWHIYRNNSLRLIFRYPGDWGVSKTSNSAAATEVAVSHGVSSIFASIVPVTAGTSISQTLRTYIGYQQKSTHSSIWSHIRWSSTSLAGQPARVAIDRPPSEGGVGISNAVYVTQWRGRVYQVLLFSSHRPPLARLNQFPAIYFTILGTWHFL